MDTIAMDTNPFVAGAARAVEDALPRAWVTETLRNEWPLKSPPKSRRRRPAHDHHRRNPDSPC